MDLLQDFGQKLKGAVECPTCGMTYVLGDPDDETLHKKFHRKLLAALEFRVSLPAPPPPPVICRGFQH